MCGRFTQSHSWAQLQSLYDLVNEIDPDLKPSWNVAPTQQVDVVLDGERGLTLQAMRWGLVPAWANDPAIGNRMINARSETAASKPAFRSAFQSRRCVIPASGFYEWQRLGKAKLPHFISSKDGSPLSLAGLWERWRAPDETLLTSFTILTTQANPGLTSLHERMPVILAREDVSRWVRHGDAELLRPCPDDWLHFWPVSTQVNSPANDAPQLVEPTANVSQDLFSRI